MNKPHVTDLSKDFKNEINDLKNNIKEIKATVIKKVAQSAHKIPEAIEAGEEKISTNIESHPLSSVGLAAVIGFILGNVFSNKVKQ